MDEVKLKAFFEKDHEEVPGWFFPLDQLLFYELFVAQSALQIEGDLCEIGVFRGKSLVLLSLLRKRGEGLLGFDLFADEDEAETIQNLTKYGDDKDTTLIKGLTSSHSQDDLDATITTPLRFLHVDAGHEYHEVLEQLHLFTPYMAEHGIIAMDDYQDREFPGIEAAVLDFADLDRPRRFVPFLSGGNKLFLCYSPMAMPYQKLLLDRPNLKDACRLTRVRDFSVLISRSKLPVTSQQIVAQLDSLNFPTRPETDVSLNQKSGKFSQLTFGSGL